MDKIIFRIALENAIKYGKTNLKNIFGKVLGEKSELKNDIKKAQEEINKIVDYVNSLTPEEMKKEFSKFKIVKEVKKKVREIPDLEVDGNVVMRFAPNPNGPLSLGHCRIALWNWFFVEKYSGSYLLRFDDTDPKTKVPLREAYKWVEDDLKWLGIKIDKVVRQSSRLRTYYLYAEKLIEINGAYVCTCEPEVWKKFVWKQNTCPCRDLPVKETMKRWKKMFKGYKEGEAVYRVKTDLNNKNPALRDWAGFRRIEESKHPFSKEKVWPLLNFASAIDDHGFSVTHILRGIDLSISDDRQKYLYDYFGWTYPKTIYCGKFLVSGVKSTSESVKLIEEGKLTGWDDPRLGTIKALRRRGFLAEVILRFIKEAGINKNELNVSIEKLAAFNKDVLDKVSFRYFFVEEPIKIKIKNSPKQNLELDLHPETKKGGRKFKTHDEFYINEKLSDGFYRLMDCLNFTKSDKEYIFESRSIDEFKRKNGKILLHWLPASDALVKVELLKEDASVVNGLGENTLNKLKEGEIVQFVRVGFVKLEKKMKTKLKFIFCHK
ncbi:glutamate--tRNA ligase [Candidatus Woesearchaeota archaeon]|nr:glutamate--tRNA ligase [Candidatus Woesearchaeota archaeon]